ncbi:MAG: HRDC domain-containing protein, partial [Deferrisomatales bacterium]
LAVVHLPAEPGPKKATRKRPKAAAKATRAPKARRAPPAAPEGGLVEALRQWRLGEARRRGLPAFRILTDRTLLALAETRPETESDLLAVPGIGPRIARAHGPALLAVVRRGR